MSVNLCLKLGIITANNKVFFLSLYVDKVALQKNDFRFHIKNVTLTEKFS